MGLRFSFCQKFPVEIFRKTFIGVPVLTKTVLAVLAIIVGLFFLFHGNLIVGLIFLGFGVLIPTA
jgi:Zn-dependent membrane protease YugP